MSSFKTGGTTKWLSWLDVTSLQWEGNSRGTPAFAQSLCCFYLLVRLSFPPVKTDFFPASSVVIILCVSSGAVGWGINLSSGLCQAGQQNEKSPQMENRASHLF